MNPRTRLIPAAAAEDFARFSESVFRYGRLAGLCFAEFQGGPYNGRQLEELVQRVRSLGISGVLILLQLREAPTTRGRAVLCALAYVVLIYLLREADFHRLFTDEHVTRGRFYLDASISITQRLLAAAVMLPFFGCALFLVGRYALPILRALRAREPWAVCLTLWGTALVGSQVADQTLSGYTGKLIEEGLEATAAALAALTVEHGRADPARVLDYTDRSRSR